MLSTTVASPADSSTTVGRDGPRLPYLPGVDGLRAIAVGSVLLYHAEFSWMQGGFLGVEVFFVISGYLITSLLLAEKTRTDKVSLGTFYLRRARRLLPALLLTLVGVLVLAEIFMRDQVASLRGDVISGLTYSTNWYFIIVQKSYFESGTPSLLKHLWSLAIEEQFYLVWPLIFTGLLALFGRRKTLFIIVALAAASATWMAYLAANISVTTGDVDNAYNRLYIGTDTRAAGLLIGAALAVLWSPWRLKADVGRSAPWVLDAIGVVALGLLGWSLYGVLDSDHQFYYFGFARISLLTAAVIAVAAHPAAHLGKILGCSPMVWIGLRSYGIYLYHFPIFQLVKPDPVTDPNPNLFSFLVVRVFLTMVVAELSFRFVEMPVRKGAIGRLSSGYRNASGARRKQMRQRLLAGGALGVTSLVVLGVVVARAEPPAVPAYALEAQGAAPGEDVPNFGPDGLPIGGDPGITGVVTTTAPTGDPVASTTAEAPTTSATPTSADPNAPLDPNATPPTMPAGPPPTVAAPPTTTPHGAVRAIGDSVMLGARPILLQALGPNSAVDAAVSRQVTYAIQAVQKWDQLGQIPDVLIIHLGTNGTFNEQQCDALMQASTKIRKVLMVTNKVPRRWQDTNNTVIGDCSRRNPNAVLVDWYSYSIDHPEWFAPDGYHLKPEGAAGYAHLIVSNMG